MSRSVEAVQTFGKKVCSTCVRLRLRVLSLSMEGCGARTGEMDRAATAFGLRQCYAPASVLRARVGWVQWGTPPQQEKLAGHLCVLVLLPSRAYLLD